MKGSLITDFHMQNRFLIMRLLYLPIGLLPKNTLQHSHETITSIVLSCVYLHILIRMRYPAQHNIMVDRELEDHQLIPDTWRNEVLLQEVEDVTSGHASMH